MAKTSTNETTLDETTQEQRIAALEQRVTTLQGALTQLLGPLQQLKKLNSIPTDAVGKAANNAEALLSLV